MTDAENQTEKSSISLRKSVFIYLAFLATIIITLAMFFSAKWLPSLICFVLYLGFGFYLNRAISLGQCLSPSHILDYFIVNKA